MPPKELGFTGYYKSMVVRLVYENESRLTGVLDMGARDSGAVGDGIFFCRKCDLAR